MNINGKFLDISALVAYEAYAPDDDKQGGICSLQISHD